MNIEHASAGFNYAETKCIQRMKADFHKHVRRWL